ncbi:hypothetical protein PMAC_001951 [Pneumocystis sp. 'macacae']|nr:hypothetical protein PMAC_001951 [Pneumocystis sp. 'macacae']
MDVAAKNMLLNHNSPKKSSCTKRRKLNSLIISPVNPQQINDIISRLSMPVRSVRVAQQYANCLNAINYIGGVQAYAKLAGATWTYYVKALNVTIGRGPDRTQSESESHTKFDIRVDLDLGPAKVVSRKHAIIEYDLQGRFWECIVYGRNGIRIDNKLYRDNKRIKNILEIGGVQMMFVLPDSAPKIYLNALNYDKNNIYDEYDQIRKTSHDIKETLFSSSYKRSYKKESYGNNSVPAYHLSTSSTEYENNESSLERDLSLDSAKDIKPPYSYATMIAQAIMSTEEGKLTLSGIYSWISNNYAYYRFSKSGWQNSIRHNLSLNRAFRKVPRRADEPGKGMKWQVSPEYREELIERTKKQGLHRRTKSLNSSANINTSSSKVSLMPLKPSMQKNKAILNPPSTPICLKYSNIRDQNEHSSEDKTDYDSNSQLFSYENHANIIITTPSPAASPIYPYQYTSIIKQQDSSTPDHGEPVSKGSVSASSNHVNINAYSYYPTSSPAPFWRYMVSSSVNNTPKKDTENIGYLYSSSPPVSVSQKAIVSKPGLIDFNSTENILDLQGVDLAKGFENISKWRESQLEEDSTETSEDVLSAFSDGIFILSFSFVEKDLKTVVTEHLPVDLLRSLQLIRQLDDEICVNQLDEIALTVSTNHPEQYIKMAQLLKTSTQNRSITLSEADKLYKTVKQHLYTINQTLQKLKEAWLRSQNGKATEKTIKVQNTKEPSPSKKKQRRDKSTTEPRYCFCNQISYGQMIACDNHNCAKEWFHWDCVNITSAPKGKWTCSNE